MKSLQSNNLSLLSRFVKQMYRERRDEENKTSVGGRGRFAAG